MSNPNPICEACESGHMHYGVRDLTVTRKGMSTIVKGVSGHFCDECDEVLFDESTDSAKRYAAAGDALVLRAREHQANQLKRARLSLKLSQHDASAISGGGHNAFSRYETGKAEPLPAVVTLFSLLARHPELLDEVRAGLAHQEIA